MCCLVQAGQFAAILLIVGVALQEYLTFDAEALKYINIIPSYASIVYGCLPAAIVNIYFKVMSQHYHGAFYHTPSISFCALFANSQFSSITNYLFCEHFVM